MTEIAEHSIRLPEGNLHYYRFGSGPKRVLAWHGFMSDAKDFASYASNLGEEWCIIAPDFWFHGKSEWHAHRAPQAEDLLKALHELMKAEGLENDSFILWGFSMGERLTRFCVNAFPTQIQSVYLFSPPSLPFTRFLDFCCRYQTFIHPIIWAVLVNPTYLRGVAKGLSFLKIIHPIRKRFVLKALENKSMLYQTWLGLKNVFVDRKNRDNWAILHQKVIYVISGKNDALSPSSDWRQGFSADVTLVFKQLDFKHESFTPAHAAFIAAQEQKHKH